MPDRRDNTIIIEAVQDAVKKTVNGKIDALHIKIDEMSSKVDVLTTKMDELTPIRTGLSTIKNIKQGATFVAGFVTPFAVVGGILWGLFKLMVMLAGKWNNTALN